MHHGFEYPRNRMRTKNDQFASPKTKKSSLDDVEKISVCLSSYASVCLLGRNRNRSHNEEHIRVTIVRKSKVNIQTLKQKVSKYQLMTVNKHRKDTNKHEYNMNRIHYKTSTGRLTSVHPTRVHPTSGKRTGSTPACSSSAHSLVQHNARSRNGIPPPLFTLN